MSNYSNTDFYEFYRFKVFKFYLIFRTDVIYNESWFFYRAAQEEILRIHWRLETILKTSEKVYEVMFFDM